MIDCVEKKDCVGCKACGDICPTHAISYEIDEEGFWYPRLDKERCVSCGACIKVCPALQTYRSGNDNRKEPRTYKAYHKDFSIRYNSTSGALYYALAEAFIDDGGYIAGCIYNEDYSSAHHYISNTKKGLKKIMRSKYFQSDTEGIYRKIRELLIAGEKVLFCGTPCQTSALYGFVGKEYDNLFSVDFICRGINSPLAFSSYMDELKKKFRSEIAEVHFKNKSHGWMSLGTKVYFKNGKSYYRNLLNDPWVNAFVVGDLYMRPSCATCHYKTFPRVSDITMGDFWGLKFTEEEKKYGVSVALVNTKKGDMLLERSKHYLEVEERSFQEAVSGNQTLLYPAKINPKRREFFERIQTEPYSKVVWDILGSTRIKRAYRLSKNKLTQIAIAILKKN